jgi:hypothetical protein
MNVKYSAVGDVSTYKQAKIRNFGSFSIDLLPCHGFLSAPYLYLMEFIAQRQSEEKPSKHFHIGYQHHSEN